MTKKLVCIEPEMNQDQFGGSDTVRTVAISNDEDLLIEHCKTAYGLPVGKPDKFSWARYYVIRDTNIKII